MVAKVEGGENGRQDDVPVPSGENGRPSAPREFEYFRRYGSTKR